MEDFYCSGFHVNKFNSCRKQEYFPALETGPRDIFLDNGIFVLLCQHGLEMEHYDTKNVIDLLKWMIL
jgi:hypothetical protein